MILKDIYVEWLTYYANELQLESEEYFVLQYYISSDGFFKGVVDFKKLTEISDKIYKSSNTEVRDMMPKNVLINADSADAILRNMDKKGLINYYDGRIDNRSLDTMLAKACSITKFHYLIE